MTSNSIDLTKREMDIAIAESEYKRIKFFITTLLMGFLIMCFNFFVVKGTTLFFSYSYSKFIVVFWFLLFLLYEIIGYWIARYYLRKRIVVPGFMKIVNVSVEAAFPSLLLFALCYAEKSVIFLDSPLFFFYFILIGISSMNLEMRLGLIVGFVSAGGYLFVTLWAIHFYDAKNTILHFPPILYIARSIFMMMAALGSLFVTSEIRRRTKLLFSLARQKNEIELLFGQQVSKKVVDALLLNNKNPVKHTVTILFLDIRNFSVFAERREPEEVIDYQNKLFSPLIRIIHKYNGITNQIMGDGLMATFGAPIMDEDHADNALKAGLEILDKVRELSQDGSIPPTTIGIGGHTGPVVMGNIGNELRKQFSISGTPVIIAARLEQANKEYGTQFLISKEMYEKLKAHPLESMGKITVKNIEQPIPVYKVA